MPLKNLTAPNIKIKCTEVEQKTFKEMKRCVGKYYILVYPNFLKKFMIQMDAWKIKLGAVSLQVKWPIEFYFHKLTSTQTWYTTTKNKFISIVETQKYLRNILIGKQISIYTNHKK